MNNISLYSALEALIAFIPKALDLRLLLEDCFEWADRHYLSSDNAHAELIHRIFHLSIHLSMKCGLAGKWIVNRALEIHTLKLRHFILLECLDFSSVSSIIEICPDLVASTLDAIIKPCPSHPSTKLFMQIVDAVDIAMWANLYLSRLTPIYFTRTISRQLIPLLLQISPRDSKWFQSLSLLLSLASTNASNTSTFKGITSHLNFPRSDEWMDEGLRKELEAVFHHDQHSSGQLMQGNNDIGGSIVSVASLHVPLHMKLSSIHLLSTNCLLVYLTDSYDVVRDDCGKELMNRIAPMTNSMQNFKTLTELLISANILYVQIDGWARLTALYVLKIGTLWNRVDTILQHSQILLSEILLLRHILYLPKTGSLLSFCSAENAHDVQSLYFNPLRQRIPQICSVLIASYKSLIDFTRDTSPEGSNYSSNYKLLHHTSEILLILLPFYSISELNSVTESLRSLLRHSVHMGAIGNLSLTYYAICDILFALLEGEKCKTHCYPIFSSQPRSFWLSWLKAWLEVELLEMQNTSWTRRSGGVAYLLSGLVTKNDPLSIQTCIWSNIRDTPAHGSVGAMDLGILNVALSQETSVYVDFYRLDMQADFDSVYFVNALNVTRRCVEERHWFEPWIWTIVFCLLKSPMFA